MQRMIRIRADCKLSAKPPLIGLKSDHRDSERSSVSSWAHLSFVCIGRERRVGGSASRARESMQ